MNKNSSCYNQGIATQRLGFRGKNRLPVFYQRRSTLVYKCSDLKNEEEQEQTRQNFRIGLLWQITLILEQMSMLLGFEPKITYTSNFLPCVPVLWVILGLEGQKLTDRKSPKNQFLSFW